MRVVVYPADRYGCGHHRLIWPVEALRAQGHTNIEVVRQEDRRLELVLNGDEVVDVKVDDSIDVIVLQRVTHSYLAQTVSVLRRKGIAVVVDVDDDLSTIHPGNPAWAALHPVHGHGVAQMHSWRNLELACAAATMVTVSTPALLSRYAARGHGFVLPNYLADHYFETTHVDSNVIGWPAALHSHPNDPEVVGFAIARLVDEGATFSVTSTSPGVGRAFQLDSDSRVVQRETVVPLLEWPQALAESIGIGIAPLANTQFNQAKSWLKPLELAAAGVPWVGSPTIEYRRLHNLGCGVLARRPNDWYKILRSLRRDTSRRVELSEAGRAVAEGLRLRYLAWRWLEAWSEAQRLQQTASIAV